MTQPPRPGRLAPPQSGRPGNPSGPGSASGTGGPGSAVDNGGFQYDTVSTARPAVTLPPPPESASPTSTMAPPGVYPAPSGPGAPVRPNGPGPGPGPGQGPRPGPGPGPGPGPANGAGARPGQRPGPAAGRPGPAGPAARSPRRARLQLRHINPWTVFKFACALSIALFFIWLLTAAALYGILDATGVIGRINDAWTTVQGGDTSPPIRPSVVLLGATVIGAVNIVLFIALSTIGSIIYNLCADIIGGIEVTLSEPEA
jgi:Transmembrane domain of unknown function (DUF3566)